MLWDGKHWSPIIEKNRKIKQCRNVAQTEFSFCLGNKQLLGKSIFPMAYVFKFGSLAANEI